MLTEEQTINKEQYLPDEKERQFFEDVWMSFVDMYSLKNEPLDILSGRSLQSFWDQANKDYNVLTEPNDSDDPVVAYSSSISRDQADIFIGQLVSQMVYPSVIAQNGEQEVDRVMGKVCRGLLEWLYNNDGYPAESGHQKLTRYIHKKVVEGTVHIIDIVSKEGLESEMVPNEEIFIGNYWQPNIQKQGMVIRAKLNITYSEAEEMFGDRPNWQYVKPGCSELFHIDRPEFKEIFEGILDDENVQILYVWKKMSKKEFAENKGRLPKKAKSGYFYNVLVNDVLMFEVDNVLPYEHLNISKGIFAKFSKAEFYWGNNLPNKVHEDKAWLDAWKTLIRYKAKLNLLKPLISKNGKLVDEDIFLPSKVTPVPEGVELQTIPGVAEPVNQSDVAVMDMAISEINRGTKAPQTQIDPDTTARAAVIQEANAKILFNSFALEVLFLLSSRTYIILSNALRFLPKRTIKKIALPEQTLSDGRIGTLEVLFEAVPEMKEEELLEKSFALRKEERMALKMGRVVEKAIIDPVYASELNLYVKFEPGVNAFGKDELMKAQFNRNVSVYLKNPDLFNRRKVARKFVQYNRDDEDILQEEPVGTPAQGVSTPIGQRTPVMQGAGSQLEGAELPEMGQLPRV